MNLFKKVAWCATDDSNVYRCNLDLLDWLINIQHYSKRKEANYFFPHGDKLFLIEEKYWLNENEFDFARQILREYQKNLSQKYFANKLLIYSFTRKSTEAEYFLLTLKDFLEEHEDNWEFKGNQMYVSGHKLTDFAVAYYKMYLIAQTYYLTLRKNPLDTSTIAYQHVEDIKKTLDTREI